MLCFIWLVDFLFCCHISYRTLYCNLVGKMHVLVSWAFCKIVSIVTGQWRLVGIGKVSATYSVTDLSMLNADRWLITGIIILFHQSLLHLQSFELLQLILWIFMCYDICDWSLLINNSESSLSPAECPWLEVHL